jgi:hypothetical protein
MRLPIPRALLRPAILLAVATGFTTAAIPLNATAAGSAPSVVVHPATVGIASQVTNTAASSARSGAIPNRGVRQLPRNARAAAAPLTQAPTAGSADVANAAQSSSDSGSSGLLQHFNGVSSRDSEVTNFGAKFEPPDQGLCEGNGFVLEPVNSAYTIYRTNGKPIAGPFNVNNLFHLGGLEFTSDPRCYYDPTTNTWFVIILFLGTNTDGSFNNTSALYISVNPSGDPTKAWTTYSIDTRDATDTANGCPCFGDQPLLGIDGLNLYVSTNEFSIFGPNFNGAQIYAFSKRDLVSRRSKIHFVQFADLSIGGSLAASVQPAITSGSSEAEYFLSALDPNSTFGTFDNRIGVWAMTNRDEVGRSGAPTLSSVVIGSETYGHPPPAVQKGSSSSTLDSGDDRMQQVQFINGTIWGALDTALTIPHDATVRAAAAWFNVKPSLGDEELASATMTRQGYLALRGNYLIYPALQADKAGNAAMVFTVSGADRFAGAAFATMRSDQSSFGRVTVAAAGSGPYDPLATRWGDYSWAQLDPKSDTFWLATEYMPRLSSQTTTRERNWGTEVLQVKVGGEGNQN